MFGRRRESLDITPEDPVFSVRYIGCTKTFTASGLGCTNIPVQKIWESAPDERRMRKMEVVINTTGIILRENDKKNEHEQTFPIEDISYCNANSEADPRIFSWICKTEQGSDLDCSAVLCISKETAQAMSVVMSRSFNVAYKDWKANQIREARLQSNSNKILGKTDVNLNPGSSGVDLKSTMKPMNITTEGDDVSVTENNEVFSSDEKEIDYGARATDQNQGKHKRIIRT